MSRVSVASRAHRALRDVSRFRFAGKDAEVAGQYRSRLNLVKEPGDLIGVYENPENIQPAAILFTERGLLVLGVGTPQWIQFSEIASIHGPSNKADDFVITVLLRSGASTRLTVAGADGQFRDAFSVVRFLDRVLQDRA
jgi:hypothetical protein